MTARLHKVPGWLGYLMVGAIAITVRQLNPELPGLAAWRSPTALYLLVNASAIAAIGVGIYRHRPVGAQALAWWLVLANQVVYWGGDFLFYVGPNAWHWTSYPSLAELFSLGGLQLLFGGQRKTGSVKLLVCALVLLFGTDNIYAWMQLHGLYHGQRF